MEEPYVPFYKPYGMSEEEFEEEVRIAEQKHDEWEYATNQSSRWKYYQELYEQNQHETES